MTKDSIHGIIMRGVGGLYTVRPCSGGEELLCRARGIFRQSHTVPTVGDDVAVSPVRESEKIDFLQTEDEIGGKYEKIRARKGNDVKVDYVIDEIMPRRNLLIRPPLSNLDYLFSVIPAASPAPDLLGVDKLTVIAENYGVEPVIVINKSDMDNDSAERIFNIYKTVGYNVFKISAATGCGVDKLRDYISDIANCRESDGSHVCGAFAGVSGAGKSTLMTSLFPQLELKTGGVSRKTQRGRHTTRHVELYPVECGNKEFFIADTPGFSSLDFTRFDFFPYDELALGFREFDDCIGKCRYTKCTHIKEEGCAVIEKMKENKIAKSRHDSYIKIFEEQRRVPEWKRR